MPLDVNKLNNEIRKIIDYDYELFEGMPPSAADGAQRWANAIGQYASGLIFQSASIVPARAAFVASYMALINIPAPAGGAEAAIRDGVVAFAIALAPGIAVQSSGTFAGLPPSTPLIIQPAFAAPTPAPQIAARALSGIIDVWFRTGTVTNTFTGATINWN